MQPRAKSLSKTIHTSTMINVAALVVMFAALQLTLDVSKSGNAYIADLREQQFQVMALDEIASEMTLLLEIAIFREETKDLGLILSKSEDLQATFSRFRDVAATLQLIEDTSFATEAEPTIYALRNDVVRCVSLLRKGQYAVASRHFDRVIRLRLAPINRFVESSRYAKEVQIDSEQKRLEQQFSRVRIIVVAVCLSLIGLVTVLGKRLATSISKALAALILSTRNLAEGRHDHRMEFSGHAELDELAHSFNDFAKMRSAADRSLHVAKQAAEAANLAKSEFLANMSHEVRTPMTAILGFTEVLLAEDELKNASPQCVEALRTIERNGKYLVGIINDILDLSKIESGKMTVEKIECSPAQILEEVVDLVRVTADAKNLKIEVANEGPVPLAIISDPTRLRQILINLTGNAIKFTEVGKVRIVIRLVADSDEPKVQFDVIDTGIGMDQQQTDQLFQPFAQADSSMSRKFGGTGLGLTISKKMAELLGGDIAVQSTLGSGSTFSATITIGPLDNVQMVDHPFERTSADNPKPKPTATAVRLDCRVLLAEDGPDNQRLISFLLKKAGAEVTVAENGKLALDEALAARDAGAAFDVILMDMQMPVMDGYTATGKLREADYTGPIIALTAHAMASDRKKCIDVGCNDYMTKPVERQKLVALVADYATRDLTLAGSDS